MSGQHAIPRSGRLETVSAVALRLFLAALVVFAFSPLGVAAQRAGGAGGAGGQAPPPSIQDHTANMERMDGFFPLYWDDATGRLWMEIDKLDTEVLHMSGIAAGLGSNDIGIDRGALAGNRVVTFQKIGPKILMVQPNYRFRASTTNPLEVKAVTDAFAPSTLWSFPVGAQTGENVLVDMTDFLLEDSNGYGNRMQGYRLEASRSAIYMPMTMNFPENTEMEASLTFVSGDGGGRGGGGGGGGRGGGAFESVGAVASAGSAATIRLHHSFVQLPELGSYTPRAFDSRSGFGGMTYQDYSVALGEPMTQRYIRRHKLEAQNPGAAMSDPVEPIIYYLDNGTPEPVRSALLDGARWWNQAFEAAGFRDAFQVELLPEGVSSHDVRYNVINWVHRSTRGWSTGGSVTDPRTGEILKGVVTLGSLRVRQDYMIAEGLLGPYINGDEEAPELSEWALARIRQLSAHEVGHTIGLGHNYYNSTAGRISVLDYPHPLVTLNGDGSLDASEVYDVDIGEWDKVAINFGYRDYAGADDPAVLQQILDDAWDQDVLYMSNQDIAVSARADQWANGTDMGTELDRMMDVRRVALDRFDERVIRPGTPMAQLEEVLVPLYMHHRYQVESAASVVGGLHYIYAFRGDGRDPVSPVPADEQRRALNALYRSISPSELAIPRSVLDVLPPRPAGYGGSRELFPKYTGSMFDAISPAVVAANHTVSNLLDQSRAARVVQQNVLDPSLPGLQEILSGLANVGVPNASDSPYEAELRRSIGRVIMERVVALAGSANMPQVRAIATMALEDAKTTIPTMVDAATLADQAYLGMMASDIQRFLDRPAGPWTLPTSPSAPPGAPIGQPAQDWLGGASLLDSFTSEWFQAMEPYCSTWETEGGW